MNGNARCGTESRTPTKRVEPRPDHRHAAPSGQRQQRLPALSSDLLTKEQRRLAADMKEGIARSFQGFVNVRDDGALLGPWNPWLHHPRYGEAIWDLTKVIAFNPSVPAAIREIAILATGSRFKASYELYAHEIVAKRKGLSNEKIAAIVAGRRPVDLTKEEAVAYDFAMALVSGGVLPESTYRAAVEQFGAQGAAELSYLIGYYCMVSVTLNTFDVPVPEVPS
jgi:4-carboxymuconolactone decarboxylase